MTPKNTPLTLELFEERFPVLFEKHYRELHEKVARRDFSKMLFQFYDSMIDPQFKTLQQDMREFREEFNEFKDESLTRFDDLYKKFETLEQEYVLANHQLKRLDRETVKKAEFESFKKKLGYA